MEIRPTVLLSLGEIPAQGLHQFKYESVWRPAAARQAVRAVFLGYKPTTEGAGPCSRVLTERMNQECEWLGKWELDLDHTVKALRNTRELVLSAKLLDDLQRIPGVTTRVPGHAEQFAPQTCLIANVNDTGTYPLLEAVRIITTVYCAPITVLLIFPAPHDPSWSGARTAVEELLYQEGLAGDSARASTPPETERTLRLWILSRERETGELLAEQDLRDAVSLFCNLFAYSGWPDRPELSRLFEQRVPARDWYSQRLATFGVRAFRVPGADMLNQAHLRQAIRSLGRLLEEPAEAQGPNEADMLAQSVATGVAQARARAEGIVRPDPPAGPEPDGGLGTWVDRVKLHWWPSVAQVIETAVWSDGASVPERIDDDAAGPVQLQRRFRRLQEAIGLEGSRTPPPAAPDLQAVFESRVAARDMAKQVPVVFSTLFLGSVLAVVLAFSAGTAWGLFGLLGFVITGCLTSIVSLQARKTESKVERILASNLDQWFKAKVEEATHAALQRQLARLRRAVAERLEALDRQVQPLIDAYEQLRREDPPPLMCESVVTRPVHASFFVPEPPDPLDWRKLAGLSSADAAAAVLRWSDYGGAAGRPTKLDPEDQAAIAHSLLAAAAQERSAVPLLVQVRAVHPRYADTPPRRTIMYANVRPADEEVSEESWSGDDPFVMAKYVLTAPFDLEGSARTSQLPAKGGTAR